MVVEFASPEASAADGDAEKGEGLVVRVCEVGWTRREWPIIWVTVSELAHQL